jgi:1,4-dihydroxy-2-naphthoyl-CoA hydrolase
MMELQGGLRVDRTMAQALGFELIELGEETARGRFPVDDRVRQPFGVVHGGAYAAMAETLASAATHLAVMGRGELAMGQSNHTSFLRPVSEGSVHAEGRVRHRGRTSWVWEVDFTDDTGRLCALTRVTMAIRPGQPSDTTAIRPGQPSDSST